MSYSFQQIAQIVSGEILNNPVVPAKVTQLLIDSRQLVFPGESLFFAFTGKRNNGHQYIPELYRAGVRNFVVSQKTAASKYPGANFLLVKNVVQGLQTLAAYHRQQFDLKTIGITGSNGKTIVKEWLFQLLRKDQSIVRSPRSYNSQIGVPLSVWKIRQEDELGIFEAGISMPGEMEKLAPVIRPNVGIFTNIGDAHNEGFSSLQQKIKEKLKLFQFSDCIIYCKDHDEIDQMIREIYPDKKCFCWSVKNESDIRISDIRIDSRQSIFHYFYKNKTTEVTLPYTDDASLQNAFHCLSVLCYLNYPAKVIQERIAQLEQVAMRLELKKGINGCTLINDSYNSDFSSISIAMNFLDQQSSGKAKSIIISDILQSGGQKESRYSMLAELLKKKQISRVIAVGEEIISLKNYLPEDIAFQYFKDTTSLLQQLNFDELQNEVILIKGARQFLFEKITARLSRQVHNTVLEINLNALIHNLHVYTTRLNPGTKLMVMIKASAYGSGSIEIARLLENHHVDYFAVAYADEGVELRKAGIQTPILVLNPEEAVFETLQRYRLEPEIYSTSLLKKFIRSLPLDAAPYPVHLKMDTGLRRLGFTQRDIPELVQVLNTARQIIVKSIFSHLAGSDQTHHDHFTRRQFEVFHNSIVETCGKLGYQPLKHILNSGGILRFPEYQMDMVRLGIGLYGIDSSGLVSRELRTVQSLKASISQIKDVALNDTIGYNRRRKAEKVMKIAIISIGYADGLMRLAGNGRFQVLIQGQSAPVVGDVCMDMCMADISEIPLAKEGDRVEIFGENLPVGELAKVCNTIVYEIFTGISERVRRIYIQE